jgi:hypothetical protein
MRLIDVDALLELIPQLDPKHRCIDCDGGSISDRVNCHGQGTMDIAEVRALLHSAPVISCETCKHVRAWKFDDEPHLYCNNEKSPFIQCDVDFEFGCPYWKALKGEM